MTAVRFGWMAVVGGGAGAGKSCALRVLARLAGVRMEEAALSTATDTTELLGCFEQSELSRLHLVLLQDAAELVECLTLDLLLATFEPHLDLATALQVEGFKG